MTQHPGHVHVLIGTRPGIIKMAPLVHELARRGTPHTVVHTGQHYSASMDADILRDVGLRKADHEIKRPKDATSHARATAYMMVEIERILLEDEAEMLLVCGDANTNLAGALAARKLDLMVGHVEAGLRSDDWRMPEEHNRRMIDHISDHLFAPTPRAMDNLARESVQGRRFLVGNTIVDATLANAGRSPQAKKEFRGGAIFTLHRQENVDNPRILERILASVGEACREAGIDVVFPVHPRTAKRLHESGLDAQALLGDAATIMEPLGYVEMLGAVRQARMVITDSGGLQEESCTLGVPCVTVRDSTERQETLEVGANILAGTTAEGIRNAIEITARRDAGVWTNPYGDGRTSERIIEAALTGTLPDDLLWHPSLEADRALN